MAPAPKTGARIALAEDNPQLRKMLKTLLGVRGYQVEAYPNGAEALMGITDGNPPALVVSDLQMPQMDGLSLCKALRATFSKRQLPFIMISVLGGEDEILSALEAGANDYIVKPFTNSMVVAKVGFHLKQDEEATRRWRNPNKNARPPSLPVEFEAYTLLKELGQGSYGVVYEARRRRDQLLVALKILDPSINLDREMLARYFREIAVLASIDIPNIVRFVDSGYEDGRYFLAMKHLPGESAYTRVCTDVFSVPEAMRTGLELCQAIAGLAEQDLVHRDIKPANIVIAPDGGATLIDFGLAKERRRVDLTQSHEFMGTAEYIAPEIIEGARENVATDLYALGATLYELMVGVPAFTAESVYDVLVRVASGVPATDLVELRDDIPRPVSDLIARLMAPDVNHRLTSPVQAVKLFGQMLKTYSA